MNNLIFILSAASLLLSCGANRQGRVTILHTNDMHAQFVPAPATWIETDPQPLIGGMLALEYAVRKARTDHPHSLLLDAGDISTGTLLSKIDYDGALNGGFVEMMNLLNYDAVTIGNHEFDEGQENLAKLLKLANFDIVAANLYINGQPIAPAYKIYTIDGLRVGVIGIILADLAQVTAVKNLSGVVVADPAETAQSMIDEIDGRTDLIILLTHQGDDQDQILASKIRNADIIVGGHSHTRIDPVRRTNGVLIVQAGAKTRYLGRLTVQVAGDTVTSFTSELIPTWVDSVKSPHPGMQQLVKTFQTSIDGEYGRRIGTLKTAWKIHNHYETNLGNFITDVMRTSCQTDVAMLNSGAIRKGLPAGPITKKDVMEILPFSNYVTTFACSGKTLHDILRDDIVASITKGSGLLQISGINYAYQVREENSVEMISMSCGGEAIDPEKIYSGTTVDFVMHNWQNRYEIYNAETRPLFIADLIIEHIENNPMIEAKVEGRILRIR
ncbi:bifunctional metallophosphatase/5'-nucleotidase [candidate division KSB1 bacterium]|nr:bifunctional metallophosphatase/5'-nucleotidase [candidate division KSB1 bacterium]RQW09292.1 MAG: bifunctional metallophosphatase/5'-nucleotidase [candidate division KSB1 bacterium]